MLFRATAIAFAAGVSARSTIIPAGFVEYTVEKDIPELKSSAPVTGENDLPPCQRTAVSLSTASNTINNLGGVYGGDTTAGGCNGAAPDSDYHCHPDASTPEILLFEDVASFGGEKINLEISLGPDTVKPIAEFSLAGQTRRQIDGELYNLGLADTISTYFTFKAESTNEEVALPEFTFAVYDYDAGESSFVKAETGTLRAIHTATDTTTDVTMADDGVITKSTELSADEHDDRLDQPTNPYALTPEQKQRAILYRFMETSKFKFNYELLGPKMSKKKSRNALFTIAYSPPPCTNTSAPSSGAATLTTMSRGASTSVYDATCRRAGCVADKPDSRSRSLLFAPDPTAVASPPPSPAPAVSCPVGCKAA